MILPPKATEAAGKDFACNLRFAPVRLSSWSGWRRIAWCWTAIPATGMPRISTSIASFISRCRNPPCCCANLRSGTIDLAERVLPTDVAEIEGRPETAHRHLPALGYEAITFNLGNGDRAKTPIGQNALLRQAFETAIDRQAADRGRVQRDVSAERAGSLPASPFYIARCRRRRATSPSQSADQTIRRADADRRANERAQHARPRAGGRSHPVDGAERPVST